MHTSAKCHGIFTCCEFVLLCVPCLCLCVPMCCGTHNAVEAVEGGVEVGLLAQAIHLYHHLRQEYPQEDEFSKIYMEGRRQEERRRRSSKVRGDHQSLHPLTCICKLSTHPPIHPSTHPAIHPSIPVCNEGQCFKIHVFKYAFVFVINSVNCLIYN